MMYTKSSDLAGSRTIGTMVAIRPRPRVQSQGGVACYGGEDPIEGNGYDGFLVCAQCDTMEFDMRHM